MGLTLGNSPKKIIFSKMGEKIGSKIGQVLDSNLYYLFPNNTTIVNVKVIFDATNQLRAGIHMGNKKEGTN